MRLKELDHGLDFSSVADLCTGGVGFDVLNACRVDLGAVGTLDGRGLALFLESPEVPPPTVGG